MFSRVFICVAFVAVSALCLTGCRRPSAAEASVVRGDGQAQPFELSESDPGLDKAVDKARDTMEKFLPRLNRPKPGQTYFAVKGRFTDEGGSEQLWLINLVYADGKFKGSVREQPARLKRIRMGDTLSVNRGKITDWMLIQDGELRGGYTTRLLRSHMTPAQRDKFDGTLGAIVTETILPD